MIWSPVMFAGVDCKSEQLRARRDPTARRQLQGSSAALHPGAEGLRRVRMEADARVAKLGQKARHPPIKGPGPSRRRCACGGSGWSKYQPPLERIHGPRQREPGWDQQGRCCKSRWVIAAGLKLIVVPVDSTWM